MQQPPGLNIQIVRITLPSRYYKPGIQVKMGRSILRQLLMYPTLSSAIEDGWIQEIRSAGEKNPGRRFMINLTDKKHYHDIPISFSIMVNGQVI